MVEGSLLMFQPFRSCHVGQHHVHQDQLRNALASDSGSLSPSPTLMTTLFRPNTCPGYTIPLSRIRVLLYCQQAGLMSFVYSGRDARVKTMSLRCMRLRLESSDDSPAKEFRIEDGNVEVRKLGSEGRSDRHSENVWCENVWWRLTPEQLSIHVERNTVVAQWLERRLGWRRLLQACVGQEPSVWKVAEHTKPSSRLSR
jgi:hypothetical protein